VNILLNIKYLQFERHAIIIQYTYTLNWKAEVHKSSWCSIDMKVHKGFALWSGKLKKTGNK